MEEAIQALNGNAKDVEPLFIAVYFEEEGSYKFFNVQRQVKKNRLRFKSGEIIEAKYGTRWFPAKIVTKGGKKVMFDLVLNYCYIEFTVTMNDVRKKFERETTETIQQRGSSETAKETELAPVEKAADEVEKEPFQALPEVVQDSEEKAMEEVTQELG